MSLQKNEPRGHLDEEWMMPKGSVAVSIYLRRWASPWPPSALEWRQIKIGWKRFPSLVRTTCGPAGSIARQLAERGWRGMESTSIGLRTWQRSCYSFPKTISRHRVNHLTHCKWNLRISYLEPRTEDYPQICLEMWLPSVWRKKQCKSHQIIFAHFLVFHSKSLIKEQIAPLCPLLCFSSPSKNQGSALWTLVIWAAPCISHWICNYGAPTICCDLCLVPRDCKTQTNGLNKSAINGSTNWT